MTYNPDHSGSDSDIDFGLRQLRKVFTEPTACRPKYSSGYLPHYPAFHRAINLTIALVLFILTSPLFLLITFALLVTQGPHILYSGDRLGRNRTRFRILKFRTLDAAKAAAITADQVLPAGSNIETVLGRYLRASRLDELPQLLNIIKGDMNIIGPRPVRPAIARLQERENASYGVRYAVRPGLIGHTQAYMCHGTSKRLRSKLNCMFCSSHVSYSADLGLMLRVGYEVLRTSVLLIVRRLVPALAEQSAQHLARARQLELVSESGVRRNVLAFYGDTLRVAPGQIEGIQTILIRTWTGGRRKARIELARTDDADRFSVSPANEYGRHFVSRYLMADPVVPPRMPKVARQKVAGADIGGARDNRNKTDMLASRTA